MTRTIAPDAGGDPAVSGADRRVVSRMLRTLSLAGLGENQTGVTAIEYALIAGLVAVVIVGAVTALGTSVSGLFSEVLGGL